MAGQDVELFIALRTAPEKGKLEGEREESERAENERGSFDGKQKRLYIRAIESDRVRHQRIPRLS